MELLVLPKFCSSQVLDVAGPELVRISAKASIEKNAQEVIRNTVLRSDEEYSEVSESDGKMGNPFLEESMILLDTRDKQMHP